MSKWLNKNGFWLIAAALLTLSLYAVERGYFVASLLFFSLHVLAMLVAAHYTNQNFTKEVLTEYDRAVRSNKQRNVFKIIKGGKDK